MLRCVVTVLSVALLSGLLSHLQMAHGQRELAPAHSAGPEWVRTVDGWESSDVLHADFSPAAPLAVHPAVVAGFQLTASLFALLAFPAARAVTAVPGPRRG